MKIEISPYSIDLSMQSKNETLEPPLVLNLRLLITKRGMVPSSYERRVALASPFSSMEMSFFFLMGEAVLIKMEMMAGLGADQISA